MDRDAITEYVGRCQQLIESSPQMDEHEGQARTAVSRTTRLEPVNYLHLLDGFAVSLRGSRKSEICWIREIFDDCHRCLILLSRIWLTDSIL